MTGCAGSACLRYRHDALCRSGSPPALSPRPAALLVSAPNAQQTASPPPGADDICRAIEQDAAENELPVEFFARVIWQESRFNARAVSRKGAQGIAQFMPQTADWRGLADPFDPIAALRHSASYLRELRQKFGNLGLAAAGYNAGPGRVSEWLAGRARCRARRATTSRSSPAGPPTNGLRLRHRRPRRPRSRRASLARASPTSSWRRSRRRQRIAAYVPRWGAQLTANWSESRAWATYRALQKQYAALIGDREPIVLRARMPGRGMATRTIIRIGDDSRAYLDRLCGKLIAAGGACVVLRNNRG